MGRAKYSLLADEELRAIMRTLMTAGDESAPDAADRLAHELQLHQIELELTFRELRETRQLLDDSRRSYDQLLQSSPVGYLTLTSAGLIEIVNPAAAELLGRPPEDLLAIPFTLLLESAVVPHFLNHLRLCREKRDQVSLELTVKKPGGAEGSLQVFSMPVGEGDTFCFRIMLLDVTECRRLEEELSRTRDELENRVQERVADLNRANVRLSAAIESRTHVEQNFALEHKRFLSILDQLPAYVILHEEDYSVRFANRIFREHFGSYEGQTCHKLMFQRDEPCEACATHRIFRDHEPQIRESRVLSEHRVYQIYAYPYTDTDGASLVLTLAIDITEREKSTDERYKMEKLDSLGVLAGGIAHDYNNLLTAIIGNINLACQADGIPSEAVDLLMEAEHASLRAKGLTRQLLTFAQGGAPVKEAVSLAQVVQDSANFALSGSKVRSDFCTAADLSPVAVDAGQMSQVIQTLVINAAEAMPKGGTVQVQCENRTITAAELLPLAPGDYVCIAVTDTGSGIPKEHLGKIFDPYFTTKTKGSGLGLASAYSIVKRHGGHITVQSLPGSGSTFRVYLPVAEVELPQAEPPVIEQLGTAVNPAKKRVLVMDDEAILRKVTGVMLGSFGYEVESAADGEEALERYLKAREEGRPFDVVILDLTIPGGMGGEEAIQKLHEIDPDVKAIVSSGYCDNPVLADFSMYGFAAILPKPYRLSEMGAVVAKVLAGTC